MTRNYVVYEMCVESYDGVIFHHNYELPKEYPMSKVWRICRAHVRKWYGSGAILCDIYPVNERRGDL